MNLHRLRPNEKHGAVFLRQFYLSRTTFTNGAVQVKGANSLLPIRDRTPGSCLEAASPASSFVILLPIKNKGLRRIRDVSPQVCRGSAHSCDTHYQYKANLIFMDQH